MQENECLFFCSCLKKKTISKKIDAPHILVVLLLGAFVDHLALFDCSSIENIWPMSLENATSPLWLWWLSEWLRNGLIMFLIAWMGLGKHVEKDFKMHENNQIWWDRVKIGETMKKMPFETMFHLWWWFKWFWLLQRWPLHCFFVEEHTSPMSLKMQ